VHPRQESSNAQIHCCFLDKLIMAQNTHCMAYRDRLNCWAIARLLPKMQRIIVARFRNRSDAEGHVQRLRQLIPHASFIVVFDPPVKLEVPAEEKVAIRG
jgi:hypothetical protein